MQAQALETLMDKMKPKLMANILDNCLFCANRGYLSLPFPSRHPLGRPPAPVLRLAGRSWLLGQAAPLMQFAQMQSWPEFWVQRISEKERKGCESQSACCSGQGKVGEGRANSSETLRREVKEVMFLVLPFAASSQVPWFLMGPRPRQMGVTSLCLESQLSPPARGEGAHHSAITRAGDSQ